MTNSFNLMNYVYRKLHR